MKLFTLTLLAVAVYTTTGFSDLGDVIFKKYAMLKIFEDCYGKDTVKGLWREIRGACAKCRGEQLSKFAPFEAPSNFMRPDMEHAHQMPQAPFAQIVKISPEALRSVLGYPQQLSYIMPYQQQQYSGQYSAHPMLRDYSADLYNYRHKRDAEAMMKEKAQPAPPRSPNPHMIPSLEKLKEMKTKIQAKISNVTCIMQELGFLDAELEPNYGSIRSRIETWPISDSLKKDLCEGIDTCKDFSMCLPEKNFKSLSYLQPLAKPFIFFKCFKGKKLMSCMKKDIKEKFGEMVAEDEMMMARTMGVQNLDNDNIDPEEMTSSIFQNLYGFDFASDADIF